MSEFVQIMEVAPRDGLQNEPFFVPTVQKIAFIEALAHSGLKRIEITAFVSKKWIPPLADHAELAQTLARQPGISYAALVPNLEGYEQAHQYKLNEISLILAASQSHNLKNLNASTEQAFKRYLPVIEQAKKDKLPFRVYISCAFGCPYEGPIAVSEVLKWSRIFHNLGAYELSISDTIGVGTPEQTRDLVKLLLQEFPAKNLALHLHDTHGRALENIQIALDFGLRSFDSSAGGLGGCPYAPGAKGNIETEKLVSMLHNRGFITGINLEELRKASLLMSTFGKLGHSSKSAH